MLDSLWLRQLSRVLFAYHLVSRRQRRAFRRMRLNLEPLEDRITPSTTIDVTSAGGTPNYTKGVTVSQLDPNKTPVTLIDAINAANNTGGSGAYVIDLSELPSNTTIKFPPANNNGGNALPVITSNITIAGNGDSIEGTTNVAPQDRFRLFDVASGGDLTLQNLSLSGGMAPGVGRPAEGGAIYSSGTLNLQGVTLFQNEVQGFPSAHSTVGGYPSSPGWNAYGGGLYVAKGSVSLIDDTFSGNSAVGGNAAFYRIPDTRPGAPGGVGKNAYGGGLYVAEGSVSLNDVTFSGNSAVGGNGGSGHRSNYNPGAGGVGGNGYGGGLYVSQGSVTLTNNTLSGNTALGGIGGEGAVAYFPNIASSAGAGGNGSGGSIYVSKGSVTLTNATLSGNKAQGGTGGAGGSTGVYNGTGNDGGNGGNGGSGTGGGLVILNGSTANLTNTLIAENNVTVGAGGAGGTGLHNGTSGGSGGASDPDVSGDAANSDHDLIGDGTGGNLTNGVNGDLVGTSASPINPLLGPLQNNGGPTQTMALLPGSPAIDVGDSTAPGLPATDQRGSGYSRIVGNAVDIGAYEYGAGPDTNPVITINPSNQTVTAGGTVTFTASASGNPTPTVQWQYRTDNDASWTNLSNGTNVSGAATGTLTISHVTSAMNGYEYEAVFSNGIGSPATTTAATLTVDYAPTVTTNPNSQMVAAGGNVSFTAAANGNPTPTVQWQYRADSGASWTNLSNGTNVSGATADTLTISHVTPAMNGYEYEAVFSNGIGSPATTAATLTVDSAAFLKTDTTTQGNWKGVYGSQGYNVIEEASSYPSYAQVSASGNTDWIWSGTTNESPALQEVGNNYRLAASWFSNTTFTVNMNLSGGQTHQLALYVLDWDSKDRSEQIQITDAATGAALSMYTASNFVNGAYLVWNVSGDIDISITHLGGANAVLSGLFLDPATLSPPPSSTASFVKTDTTTQGNWKGVYGSQGYNVIEEASSYPSYAQVSANGNTDWIWSGTTNESRALQEVGNNYRWAASWFSNTTFTVNMNLINGQTHQLALYLLDWDNKDRSEQIQITDAATGTVLSTQTASNFVNGAYLVWNVSGDIDISITHLGGNNAVLSGLFLDPDEA